MDKVIEINNNLLKRFFDPGYYSGVTVNPEDNSMTAMLWNLSGQLVGFQTYSPNLPKKHSNDPKACKYFTYVTPGQIAVFGLESYNPDIPVLFITEGMFEAARLHKRGIPAIAVLGCNPLHLTSWFNALPQKIIAIVQNDKAGKKLIKFADYYATLPEGKDFDDLSNDEADLMLLQLFNQYYTEEFAHAVKCCNSVAIKNASLCHQMFNKDLIPGQMLQWGTRWAIVEDDDNDYQKFVFKLAKDALLFSLNQKT